MYIMNEEKIERAQGTRFGRSRGGQPGKQNARIHGFYSQVFTSEQRASFEATANLSSLDQEIALMRTKILSIPNQEPVNDAVLMTAILC
jgi:hypothetical protein